MSQHTSPPTPRDPAGPSIVDLLELALGEKIVPEGVRPVAERRLAATLDGEPVRPTEYLIATGPGLDSGLEYLVHIWPETGTADLSLRLAGTDHSWALVARDLPVQVAR